MQIPVLVVKLSALTDRLWMNDDGVQADANSLETCNDEDIDITQFHNQEFGYRKIRRGEQKNRVVHTCLLFNLLRCASIVKFLCGFKNKR